MTKHWMGRRFGLLVPLAALALGCQSKIEEPIEEDVFVTATFVEFSDDNLAAGLVPLLDGTAGNLEWGSADDPNRPYTFVQLSAENGYGDAGAQRFLAVKAAYTAFFNPVTQVYVPNNIYFLLQWADTSPSKYKDSFVYAGISIEDLKPRVENYYRSLYGDISADSLATLVTDSLQTVFLTDDGEPRPENWVQLGGDDLLLLMFGDGEATDGTGRSFRTFGLQVARNGDWYGPLASGFLDSWLWSASRTNPLVESFDPEDVGGDVEPQQGFAGYCDDYYLGTAREMTQDDGPCLWIPNYTPTLAEDDRVPLRAWNPRNDPNRDASGGGKCNQLNMGLPFPWLHRASIRGADFVPNRDDDKLTNHVVFQWETKDPEQARRWQPGDFIAGYALGHDFADEKNIARFTYCLPGCIPSASSQPNCGGEDYDTPPHILNTLQVRAHGAYDERTRHWILEIARPLSTPWGNTSQSGNEIQDIDFDHVLDRPRDFYIAFALWDEGEDRGPRLGSLPVRIHFEPPPPREE